MIFSFFIYRFFQQPIQIPLTLKVIKIYHATATSDTHPIRIPCNHTTAVIPTGTITILTIPNTIPPIIHHRHHHHPLITHPGTTTHNLRPRHRRHPTVITTAEVPLLRTTRVTCHPITSTTHHKNHAHPAHLHHTINSASSHRSLTARTSFRNPQPTLMS
uniref:(northern house mosquito) hypothetical protein n=1 Tax=Culex pipiens TaxID=7175 RepID=A0A8D8CQ50_CULPI